jgi:hypothetical protein
MLPDRRRVVFSLVTRASTAGQSTAWDTARVVVQTLYTGERRELVRDGDARILPTCQLAYALGTVLLAARFDVERLEVTGPSMPPVEGSWPAGQCC